MSDERHGAREVAGADHRAHAIFDQWDKHPDAPAYWFRLPSWVQQYATECVAATERRLAASRPTDAGAGRGKAIEAAARLLLWFQNHEHAEVSDAKEAWEALSDALDMPAALATPKPPVDVAKETLESIVTWGDETFGPCTAERAVSRGREELDEADLEAPGTPQHAVEIADTIICFLRVPGILEAINAKMAINRKRQWNVGTDGTGYHIKSNLTGDGAGA